MNVFVLWNIKKRSYFSITFFSFLSTSEFTIGPSIIPHTNVNMPNVPTARHILCCLSKPGVHAILVQVIAVGVICVNYNKYIYIYPLHTSLYHSSWLPIYYYLNTVIDLDAISWYSVNFDIINICVSILFYIIIGLHFEYSWGCIYFALFPKNIVQKYCKEITDYCFSFIYYIFSEA